MVAEVGTEVPAEVAVVVSMVAERSAMREKISWQRGPRVTRLQLVERRGEPLGTANNRPVRRRCFLGNLCFLPVTRPPASPRLRSLLLRYLPLEVDPTRHICLAPNRPAYRRRPTLWASGSSAESLARSSAFSFPETPLWAGHHQISMMMPGLALRSAAMCFLAWIAYIWPAGCYLFFLSLFYLVINKCYRFFFFLVLSLAFGATVRARRA